MSSLRLPSLALASRPNLPLSGGGQLRLHLSKSQLSSVSTLSHLKLSLRLFLMMFFQPPFDKSIFLDSAVSLTIEALPIPPSAVLF